MEHQKMIVQIELYNPRCSEIGSDITYRDKRVVMGSCKSSPSHRMDSNERCVYASFWNTGTFEENLEIFKDRLKKVVYENDNIEFKIIDSRDNNLPHKNMY